MSARSSTSSSRSVSLIGWSASSASSGSSLVGSSGSSAKGSGGRASWGTPARYPATRRLTLDTMGTEPYPLHLGVVVGKALLLRRVVGSVSPLGQGRLVVSP